MLAYPSILAVLLALVPAASSQAAEPMPKLRLTDEAITKAVRETLAESPDKAPARAAGPLRGDRYEQFARRVDDAVVPGCLRPDGLKHQPPKIGPIGFGGIFALPFMAAAKIRGKCR